jgi:hypothetical protein
VSAAKHTPGSIAALAEKARMMPWEKAAEDVPFDARYAFQQAITADHYLELLEACQLFIQYQAAIDSDDPASRPLEKYSLAMDAALAAVKKATGGAAA